MPKRLPPKVLDEELIKELIKYYQLKTIETKKDFELKSLMEWECFSHPSLELHECNCRALLPGKHNCNFCNHILNRPCDVSCDIQTFCLAVFGWRLGIGEEDLLKSLKHNLYKLTPDELYDAVIYAISNEGKIDEEILSTVNKEKVEKKAIKKEKQKDDKLLTIKEAAEIVGKHYNVIYNNVKSGKIPSETEGRRIKIRESDILSFMGRDTN